jgi:hypothetical protein
MPESISTRPLLDKLGVWPGARVALIGLAEPWFERLLAERATDITLDHAKPESDLIFLGAESTADLAPLPALRNLIVPAGGIWVVSRKGRSATLRDVEVIAAAIDARLVDNKVVAFSETQTALRLVIPRADRPAAR